MYRQDSNSTLDTLRAAINRIIPADDFSGAWDAGAGDYIRRQLTGDLHHLAPLLDAGLASLDAEARSVADRSFVDLPLDGQDRLLADVERGGVSTAWPVSPQDFFAMLVRLTSEGYYGDPGNGGNREAVSWRMVGYDPRGAMAGGAAAGGGATGVMVTDGAGGPPESAPAARVIGPSPSRMGDFQFSWGSVSPSPAHRQRGSGGEGVVPVPDDASDRGAPMSGKANVDYDAIVVGAGAAGGIVACVLAEAGKRVLLLERGRRLAYAEVGRDHLRNHRLSLYGHNTGPDLADNPRVFVDPRGSAHLVRPHEDDYHNNAACVGGGTRVYGGMAWRFLPRDFRMASSYGVPPGSSLADWPLTYDDLEPYYERAEWEIGVAGDSQANDRQGPRRRGYPLPPLPANPQREVLARGAERLGISTFPPPVLINTAPYRGRPACAQCGMCVGFACPVDAKNGTHNTAVPRALATGRCVLVEDAMAERVLTDDRGRATGVSYYIGDRRAVATARTVVVSCGAIESARLLLNSATERSPRGLGNDHDQVGRHLQGHYYPGALGLMPEPCHDGRGPGISIATCAYNHDNPGVIGGAVLVNEFIKLPVIHQRLDWPPDAPRWGLEAKRFMRESYTRTVHIQGPVQEIPHPESRITVDPRVRDRWGIPVARLSGTTHPETVRTADHIRQRAEEWLRSSGAVRVWSGPPRLHLSAGQHQAGTCRMGDDPRGSVTDPWGRVHGHDGLFVADGSLHVTNGGFNPVLTIMALAFRTADGIARAL